MKIKEFLPGLSIAILISLLAWFLGNLFPIIGGPVLGLFIGLLLGIILRDSQKLKDMFIQQTRLQLVNANGDLEIDGEITGYNQYNEAVAADGYSSKVKLTMTVNVRYVNNTNHEEDFEQQFSAFQTYDSSLLLTDVQDDLISKMIKDITEQIFNSTVANW